MPSSDSMLSSSSSPRCPRSSGVSAIASFRTSSNVRDMAEILPRLHRLAQLLGLEVADERFEEDVQIAVHDVGQIVDGEADAVVRDAVLRKVIGADFLGAV